MYGTGCRGCHRGATQSDQAALTQRGEVLSISFLPLCHIVHCRRVPSSPYTLSALGSQPHLSCRSVARSRMRNATCWKGPLSQSNEDELFFKERIMDTALRLPRPFAAFCILDVLIHPLMSVMFPGEKHPPFWLEFCGVLLSDGRASVRGHRERVDVSSTGEPGIVANWTSGPGSLICCIFSCLLRLIVCRLSVHSSC